ncbi:MAG TPA: hypothetical protein VEJ18_02740, partial [Planctomycetota bacterium]|nr:hypothetical protein [Planctomycetota bacterium]
MISLLRLALALLVVWAAGAGPATELARRRAAGGWGVWAATSFVLGFGIVGLASVVAMLVGVRVGLFLPPVVAVLSLAWAVLRRPRGSSAPTEPAGALPRALVIAVAVAGAALAAAGDDPGWDVRAFWSLKARSIATHG